MSLINQMLDDLEERQARLAGDEDAILAGLSAAASDQNFHTFHRRRRFIIIACLLAITASLLVYFVNPTRISPSAFTVLFRPTNSSAPLTSEATQNSISTLEVIPLQNNAADTSNISTSESIPVQIEIADNSDVEDLDEDYSLNFNIGTLGDLKRKLLADAPIEDYGDSVSTANSELPRINHIVTETDRSSSNITIQLSEAVDRLEIVKNDSVYDLTIAIAATDEITEDNTSERREPDKGLYAQSSEGVPVPPKQQPSTFNRAMVSADDIYKKGLQLHRRGRVSEGLQQIMRAVNLDPSHIQARTTLATYLVDQGNQKLAMDILQEGLELHPGQFDWAQLKAHLLLEVQDVNGAVNALQAVLPDIQKDPDYHAFLAALLQRQGRHEEAVQTYRDIMQVRPNNGIWWMGLGISLEKIEQLQDANYAYEKALNDNSLTSELKGYLNKRIMVISRR